MYTRRQVLEAALAIAPLAQVPINSSKVQNPKPAAQNKTYTFTVYPPEAEGWSKYNLPYGFEIFGDKSQIRAAYSDLRRLDIIPDVAPANAVLEHLIADMHDNPLFLARRFSVTDPSIIDKEKANLHYIGGREAGRHRESANLFFFARLGRKGHAELINLDAYWVSTRAWTDRYREVNRNASLDREEWYNHVSPLEYANSIVSSGRHATILPVDKKDTQSFREVDMDGFRRRLEEAIRTQVLRFTPEWNPVGQRPAQKID